MGRYWQAAGCSCLSDLSSGQQPGPPHSRGALLEELRSLEGRRQQPASHYHLQRRARLCQTGGRAPPEGTEGRWEAFDQIGSSFLMSFHHPSHVFLLTPSVSHRRYFCAGVQTNRPCGGGGGGGRCACQHLSRLHHAGKQRDRCHHGEGLEKSRDCLSVMDLRYVPVSESVLYAATYIAKKKIT